MPQGNISETNQGRVIRTEQEKYVKTFRAVPDVVIISNIATGEFLEVNDAAFRVFRYSREELIGKSALDLCLWDRPEDRADLLARVQEQGSAGTPALGCSCHGRSLPSLASPSVRPVSQAREHGSG